MASIATEKSTGYRTIQFMDGRRRRGIWLGKVQKRSAETIKFHVEELITARNEGCSPFNETSAWVGRLGDDFYVKLAKVDLVPRRSAPEKKALGPFLDDYIAKRRDVKAATAVVYGHTQRCLVDFFGTDKPLEVITAGDADDWRRWLGGPLGKKMNRRVAKPWRRIPCAGAAGSPDSFLQTPRSGV